MVVLCLLLLCKYYRLWLLWSVLVCDCCEVFWSVIAVECSGLWLLWSVLVCDGCDVFWSVIAVKCSGLWLLWSVLVCDCCEVFWSVIAVKCSGLWWLCSHQFASAEICHAIFEFVANMQACCHKILHPFSVFLYAAKLSGVRHMQSMLSNHDVMKILFSFCIRLPVWEFKQNFITTICWKFLSVLCPTLGMCMFWFFCDASGEWEVDMGGGGDGWKDSDWWDVIT